MKTYGDIIGFFDFSDVYTEAVNKYKTIDSPVFVEIGAYLGKSTAYMCYVIKNSGNSNFKFHTVDTFKGAPSDIAMVKLAEENGGTFRSLFEQNLRHCGLLNYVNIIESDSVKAASLFEDNSVDFLFIDGAHEEESVIADIKAWKPKMKKGSTIAGHDWLQDGVKSAVNKTLKDVSSRNQSWIVNL